ncbi:cache domain-containing sensor histidine kinase [Anaerorhabdus sp.]|uniref:cache domain-containing sensor histidine kinase n=2 Tax=Anaerorhabdus sp. TaxID=1872524 RepID=UPI002FCAE0E2
MEGKKRKYRLRNISSQISILYMSISLAIILIFSVVIFYNVSNIFVNDAVKQIKMNLNQSSDYLSLYIEKVKLTSSLMADNPNLISYLKQNDDELNVRNEISTVLEADPYLETIVIVANDGRVISNEEKLEMQVSDNMMEEEWYQHAISDNMPFLTGARMQKLSMDNDKWVISLSREITDDQGNNLGVLLIDINYEFITEYISALNLDQDGFVFIIDKNQNLVYHNDLSYFIESDKQEELKQYLNNTNNKGLLTYQVPINNTDWSMIGVSYLNSLGQLRRQLLELIAITGLIILAGVTFLGRLLVKRISNPLRELTVAMQDAESFVPAKVNPDSSDEVKSLVQNYNDMLIRIKDLLEKLSISENERKELEIKVLMGQINPHFLYNTLDTIIWMSEFKENEQVIELTKSLAKFFRLSLSKGNNLIPLAQEIDHLKQYLFIQKQRYGDKLTYDIHIDESLNNYLVPRIILQPIVENSIYHGIKNLDGPGKIDVEAYLENNHLIIVVKDNGVGFNPKQVDKTNVAQLSGIGIDNVIQRIKLYCGEEYGLTIESTEHVGTTVTLVLAVNLEN